VEVDTGRREARVEGRSAPLATREFDLLQYLAENRGWRCRASNSSTACGGVGWYGDERTVDVHVGQLRKKLGEALPLTTVWGVGYRLD
jgi:DNA-binding response OmpR family regulator